MAASADYNQNNRELQPQTSKHWSICWHLLCEQKQIVIFWHFMITLNFWSIFCYSKIWKNIVITSQCLRAKTSLLNFCQAKNLWEWGTCQTNLKRRKLRKVLESVRCASSSKSTARRCANGWRSFTRDSRTVSWILQSFAR